MSQEAALSFAGHNISTKKDVVTCYDDIYYNKSTIGRAPDGTQCINCEHRFSSVDMNITQDINSIIGVASSTGKIGGVYGGIYAKKRQRRRLKRSRLTAEVPLIRLSRRTKTVRRLRVEHTLLLAGVSGRKRNDGRGLK